MKNLFRLSSAVILLSLLASCSAFQNFRKPAEIDSLDAGVKMDFKKFLDGNLEGFAIIQDQNGKIIGTQSVKVNGKWDDNKGVISQNFTLFDGSKDSRTWLITFNNDGTFSAIGHDVIAPGSGKQVGNAAQMAYTLLISDSKGKMEKRVVDKFYLVDEKSAIVISEYRAGFSSSGKMILSLKKLTKE